MKNQELNSVVQEKTLAELMTIVRSCKNEYEALERIAREFNLSKNDAARILNGKFYSSPDNGIEHTSAKNRKLEQNKWFMQKLLSRIKRIICAADKNNKEIGEVFESVHHELFELDKILRKDRKIISCIDRLDTIPDRLLGGEFIVITGQSMAEKLCLTLTFDKSEKMTPFELVSRCRQLKLENRLDYLIIDYIQLINPTINDSENKKESISYFSHSLKNMALELYIPVIAVLDSRYEPVKYADWSLVV